MLGREEDVEVIAEAGDLLAAMRQVNGHLPHVLALDLQMPDGSSIELIGSCARVPETEIVVVTMEDSPAYRARRSMPARSVTCSSNTRRTTFRSRFGALCAGRST